MSLTVQITIRSILFLVSAGMVGFFACAEASFLGMDKWSVENMEKKDHKNVGILKKLSSEHRNTLSAMLIGTNIFMVLTAVMASSIAVMSGLKGAVALIVVSVFTTAFLFVFSELIPKNYAASRPTETALAMASIIGSICLIFKPVSFMVSVIPTFLAGLVNRKKRGITEESDTSVRVALDIAEENGLVAPDETEVMLAVLDSSDKTAGEIMTPMNKLVSLTEDATIDQAIQEFSVHRFSRIPILDPQGSKIKGVLYLKDIMAKIVELSPVTSGRVTSVMRKPYTVSAQESVLDVLSKMKSHKIHFAVVMDQRKPVGIITIEDLLEEIVGDIKEDTKVRKGIYRRETAKPPVPHEIG